MRNLVKRTFDCADVFLQARIGTLRERTPSALTYQLDRFERAASGWFAQVAVEAFGARADSAEGDGRTDG
jgi:hypothetical protein